jgi:hypothetical protein
MAQAETKAQRQRRLKRERDRRYYYKSKAKRDASNSDASNSDASNSAPENPTPSPTASEPGAGIRREPVPNPAFSPTPAPNSAPSSTGRTFQTVPLERLPKSGEVGAAPPVEAPGRDPAELAAEAESVGAGADLFAGVVALMVTVTVADLVANYGDRLDGLTGAVGLQIDPAAAPGVVAGFVRERAHRVAIKYGFAFSIPYEDEIVTGGAIALSGWYLWRKVSGAADDQGAEADSAPESAPSSTAGAVRDRRETVRVPERPSKPEGIYTGAAK